MKTATRRQQGRAAADFQHLAHLPNALKVIKKSNRYVQLKLGDNGVGRIALHLIPALKTSHYAWHLHGIARELTRH